MYQEMLCVSDGSAGPCAGCVSDPLHWHNSRVHGVDERQGECHSIVPAQQQTLWSPWKMVWKTDLVESMKDGVRDTDLVKSVKDKVSSVLLYQHNSRPCGVHGRWCERQTLRSPWKMGSETQTLWSRWKTRWVPFYCTSTTADLVESMKDGVKDRPCGVHERWGGRRRPCGVSERQGEFHSVVPAQQLTLRSPWMTRVCIVSFHYTGSVISLHVFWGPWMTLTKWVVPLHSTGIALLQPTLWSPWMTRWVVPFQHTGVTADLVESMNDKMVSSFSLYWHCSRDCGVHEWQGG